MSLLACCHQPLSEVRLVQGSCSAYSIPQSTFNSLNDLTQCRGLKLHCKITPKFLYPGSNSLPKFSHRLKRLCDTVVWHPKLTMLETGVLSFPPGKLEAFPPERVANPFLSDLSPLRDSSSYIWQTRLWAKEGPGQCDRWVRKVWRRDLWRPPQEGLWGYFFCPRRGSRKEVTRMEVTRSRQASRRPDPKLLHFLSNGQTPLPLEPQFPHGPWLGVVLGIGWLPG